MVGDRGWPVLLSEAAQADLRNILRWSADRFGEAQARRYANIISEALEALTEGPRTPGSRTRDEIGKGLMTLHIARGGRRGRNFILYRTGSISGTPTIQVLRLLHDAMDLPRHIARDGIDAP